MKFCHIPLNSKFSPIRGNHNTNTIYQKIAETPARGSVIYDFQSNNAIITNGENAGKHVFFVDDEKSGPDNYKIIE